MERPYLNIDELADLFGMTKGSLLNSICRETFTLPTYKIGRQRVADRAVVEAFFEAKRAEGLAQITT
jgi:hypothetical protein|tara:strand:- start:373 stop:573 length:201 start_codon:yes stop_codon:yes gene_type:complete